MYEICISLRLTGVEFHESFPLDSSVPLAVVVSDYSQAHGLGDDCFDRNQRLQPSTQDINSIWPIRLWTLSDHVAAD